MDYLIKVFAVSTKTEEGFVAIGVIISSKCCLNDKQAKVIFSINDIYFVKSNSSKCP